MDIVKKQLDLNCLLMAGSEVEKALNILRDVSTPDDDQELFDDMCSLRMSANKIKESIWNKSISLRREIREHFENEEIDEEE